MIRHIMKVICIRPLAFGRYRRFASSVGSLLIVAVTSDFLCTQSFRTAMNDEHCHIHDEFSPSLTSFKLETMAVQLTYVEYPLRVTQCHEILTPYYGASHAMLEPPPNAPKMQAAQAARPVVWVSMSVILQSN